MSKAITSIAIMQLYEKSTFRLDDPVFGTFFMEKLRVYQSGIYPNFLTSRPMRHMTIRDLLTHMSGLTYDFMYRTNVDAAYRKTKVQQAEFEEFVEILSTLPLEFSPGDKWNYSVSLMPISSRSPFRMKLEEYLKKFIFEPLKWKISFSAQKKRSIVSVRCMNTTKGDPRLLEIPFLNSKWSLAEEVFFQP